MVGARAAERFLGVEHAVRVAELRHAVGDLEKCVAPLVAGELLEHEARHDGERTLHPVDRLERIVDGWIAEREHERVDSWQIGDRRPRLPLTPTRGLLPLGHSEEAIRRRSQAAAAASPGGGDRNFWESIFSLGDAEAILSIR